MVFHQYDMHKNNKGRRGVDIGGAGEAQGSQGEGEREREKGTREQRKRRGSEIEQEEGEEKAPKLRDNQLVNQKARVPS